MGQLLAVHQEKLDQQEKIDEVLFNKIDHLHIDLHKKTEEIKKGCERDVQLIDNTVNVIGLENSNRTILDSLHQARAYLLGRGIPEDKLHLFYYCPNFKKWTNKQKEVFADTKNDDDRIIIPLIDQDGKLFGFQGRSLDFNAKMRYITVMLDEDQHR